MMRAICAALLLTVFASPVWAQDEFQTHLDAGLQHYEAREYAQAAAEFQAAFDLRPEPDLLYNVARSYERAVMRAEAIAAYDRFLELPGTTSEMRQRALGARNSLESEVRALERRESDANAATNEETTEPTPQPTPTPPPPEEPSALRPVGFAMLGVGAAAAIVGGVFGGLALKANSDFEDATGRAEQIELRDDVNRNALLADVLVGVGAATAVVGVVLIVLGKSGTNDASATRVTPTFGRDGVGVQLRASF
ncbi:MAG: hypothetical protein KC586_21495 [Myxococcales bacterium]|nr:hypothetical protein [Myxococcales bacterium]